MYLLRRPVLLRLLADGSRPGTVRFGCAVGDVAESRRSFEGWHDPVPAVLAAVDEGSVLRHELNFLDPPLPSYVAGNAALAGNAAHAMTPDLGQDVCQALIDGTALAECLGDGADGRAGSVGAAGFWRGVNGCGQRVLRARSRARCARWRPWARRRRRSVRLSYMSWTWK